MRKNRLLWLWIILMLVISAAARADLTVVDQGAPKAVIVIAKSAVGAATEPTPESLAHPLAAASKIAAAARDLQVYVEKLSGAKLPIIGDDQAPPSDTLLILVGRSALTKDLDARIPSGKTPTCDEEGYTIIAKGSRVLLAGNDQAMYHGTEYAVAELLHRWGVRWYMPGDFGDFIPHLRKATLTVPELDIVSHPDFKMRDWWFGLEPADLKLIEYRWKIRNGMNPNTNQMVDIPTDGSVTSALPDPKEINSKDLVDVWGKTEQGTPNDQMPNLTSEKSVHYAAEKIKAAFRKDPNQFSFGMAGKDGLPLDFSPKTMERNLGMRFTGGRLGIQSELSITDEWMDWIQAVAQEVYKDYPDHFITTNGYANRTDPPLSVKPDPKVWVMFAAIWADTMHAYDNPRSWQTIREAQLIKEWASRYKNVFMYDYIYYMLAGCGAPIPLSHKQMHDMPLLKDWGVVGFIDEGRTVRGESGVFPTYLRARMMWDAHLDGKKEMDEFFTNWYGPARKPALAFWEDLENTFETTPWLGHEDRILPYVYSQKLIDRLENDVKKAEALATDPTSKAHVLGDRVSLEGLKAFMAMNRAEWDANFTEAARQAQRMMDVRKPATALSRFYFNPNKTTGDCDDYIYWGAASRRDYYQTLADLTTGKTGDLVAVLPEKARFKTDPRDDGRYFKWYDAAFKDSNWESILTTEPFYRQGEGCVEKDGFPYMGPVWYRMDVDVPASAQGKKVIFYVPAVETEAWVWVNGQFIAHRPYRAAYERPNQIEMDVTAALKPGQKNVVTIRVDTGTDPTQQTDAMTSRAFLYSPYPAKEAPPKK